MIKSTRDKDGVNPILASGKTSDYGNSPTVTIRKPQSVGYKGGVFGDPLQGREDGLNANRHGPRIATGGGGSIPKSEEATPRNVLGLKCGSLGPTRHGPMQLAMGGVHRP